MRLTVSLLSLSEGLPVSADDWPGWVSGLALTTEALPDNPDACGLSSLAHSFMGSL